MQKELSNKRDFYSQNRLLKGRSIVCSNIKNKKIRSILLYPDLEEIMVLQVKKMLSGERGEPWVEQQKCGYQKG